MIAHNPAIVNFSRAVDRTNSYSKPAPLLPHSPWSLQQPDKPTLHSPLPQHHFPTSLNDYAKLSTLSASPASSVASSSTSKSLTLESEEIKRIFSNDPAEFEPTRLAPSAVCIRPPQWAPPPISPLATPRDPLNPHARSFVPTLAPIPDELAPALPSPFDLGPAVPATLRPPPRGLPLSPPPTPQYPPGLPHPPRFRHLVGGARLPELNPSQTPFDPAAPSEPLPKPTLTELIQKGLNPVISAWHRDLTANQIITFRSWIEDTVPELARLVFFEACQSGYDPAAIGQEVKVCPEARYWPVGSVPEPPFKSPPEVAAILCVDICRQMTARYGEDLTRAFSSTLREVTLQTFLSHWDTSSGSSIHYFPTPSLHYVRSAIAVSTAVAALYTHNFITHADVDMCIKVLLSNLKSVEHAEALSNIVLGSGRRFWASIPAVMANPSKGSMILKKHVGEFLLGLEANCDIHQLNDQCSVVKRPWARGQLMVRLHEVANSVKAWDADLQGEMQLR